MKISLKLVVFSILAVFIAKISIADSWHDKKPQELAQTRLTSLD